MPYDSRSSTGHHVQDSHHRQRSRRRIAAVSFLSNISLDGTHKDTNLHCVSSKIFCSSLPNNSESISNSLINKKKSLTNDGIPQVHGRKNAVSGRPCKDITDQSKRVLENDENDKVVSQEKKSKISTIDKQSTNKTYNPNKNLTLDSFDKLISMNKNKKSVPNIMPSEKSSYAKNVINKVKSLRTRAASTTGTICLTELKVSATNKENLSSILVNEKELKISQNSSKSSLIYIETEKHLIRSSNEGINERDKGLPTRLGKLSTASVDTALIGSSLAKEIKHLRSSGLAGPQNTTSSDNLNSRKRTSSGSRHLPTIADKTDSTLDLTSHHTPPSGSSIKFQEISYSNLLVSSPYFGLGKQYQVCGKPASILTQTQHIAVSRCFSHDPNMHNQHQEAVRHSHPQMHTASAICQSVSCTAGNLNSLTIPNYILAPELLDDPQLKSGKHRKLFSITSYMTSVIQFAKPDEFKREMNDNFRKKFPHVRITLSKLRSLKREMVYISRSVFGPSLDNGYTLTLSHAHAYFDCLCLNGKVEKINRKALAGACLMISAKINDVKGEELEELVEKIEGEFRVDRSELVSSEITVLLSLQFNIHLPIAHINTHLQRLLFEH